MKTNSTLTLLLALLLNTSTSKTLDNSRYFNDKDFSRDSPSYAIDTYDHHESSSNGSLNRGKAFDIVINEIMADPDPVVGLPNCEYIELYNRSPFPVTMNDWSISIGSSVRMLPDCALEPGGYFLVTLEGKEELLKPFGEVITIPGLALLNSGTSITLKNHADAVIHTVTYSDNWYDDNVKNNGGWSLEQVDPVNPCMAEGNWKASRNLAGGTPGTVNSVNAYNKDKSSPVISFIGKASESSLIVFFSEPMDSTTLVNLSSYSVDHGIGQPTKVMLHGPLYDKVTLQFLSPFTGNTIYTLQFSSILTDCLGNSLEQGTLITFSLPSIPEANDIVINELMYEPLDSGSEFIEIYNLSFKSIDLYDIWLALKDPVSNEIKSPVRVSSTSRFMLPGQYVLLSKYSNRAILDHASPGGIYSINVNGFPTLINSGGTVVLLCTDGLILDEFNYHPGLHLPLLNSTKGVSLERVDPLRQTSEPSNWQSASRAAGFSTPGYQNSQFMQLNTTSELVSIEPQSFSPDGDGYNDQLFIKCMLEEPGHLITIKVFDCNGQQVKSLVANEAAGINNVFSWDGTTDKREKAPAGIYVIFTEIFNLEKAARHFKNTAVLSVKL